MNIKVIDITSTFLHCLTYNFKEFKDINCVFGFSNIKLLFKLLQINLMRHINTIYALTISLNTFTLKI